MPRLSRDDADIQGDPVTAPADRPNYPFGGKLPPLEPTAPDNASLAKRLRADASALEHDGETSVTPRLEREAADALDAEPRFTPDEIQAELAARRESPARFFVSAETEREFQRAALLREPEPSDEAYRASRAGAQKDVRCVAADLLRAVAAGGAVEHDWLVGCANELDDTVRAPVPTDEEVAAEMSGYDPGTVGFQSCLDDVVNVRAAEARAVRAAEQRVREGR